MYNCSTHKLRAGVCFRLQFNSHKRCTFCMICHFWRTMNVEMCQVFALQTALSFITTKCWYFLSNSGRLEFVIKMRDIVSAMNCEERSFATKYKRLAQREESHSEDESFENHGSKADKKPEWTTRRKLLLIGVCLVNLVAFGAIALIMPFFSYRGKYSKTEILEQL